MEIKCNFCDKLCTDENGIFICEDGHIATYTQELTEGVQGTLGKSKKRNAEKLTGLSEFKTYSYIFTELYLTMKTYFNLKNDLVYKIYLSFIDFEQTELFNFTFMYAIIYYSMRVDYERRYEILTVRHFDNIFPVSLYMYTYKKLCDKYMIKRLLYNQRFKVECYKITIKRLSDYIRFFGEVYIKTRSDTFFLPGQEENYNLENKRIFRSIVRRDQVTMEKYLREIASDLKIDVTEKMMFYYKKFCDLYLNERRTFVPDLLIISFVFIYLMNVPNSIKLDEIEEHLSKNEAEDDRFKREIAEFIFLEENNGDITKYRSFKENLVIQKTFKEFYSVHKPQNRLKLIFSFYLRISTNEFALIIKNYLLFFDSCTDKILYSEFFNYEKRKFYKDVEARIRYKQNLRLEKLMRFEKMKYRKYERKMNKQNK